VGASRRLRLAACAPGSRVARLSGRLEDGRCIAALADEAADGSAAAVRASV
jgi:hypothetical protein